MAKQTKSVFSKIADSLKGSPEVAFPQSQKSVLTGAPTPASNNWNELEIQQQEFLNIQSQKIAFELHNRSLQYTVDRTTEYMDYRTMDMTPEISAALDILSDECVTRSEHGNILEIYSDNIRVKKVLEHLFNNTLNISHNLWYWIRELLKYGDNFLKLEIEKGRGIYDIVQLPAGELYREEHFNGETNSARYKWDINNVFLEDWQIAHFRLVGDGAKLPYGKSILYPARKLWKQLQLAEDAILVARLVRAPDRKVFYVDVGNVSPDDIPQYVEKFKAQIKKSPVVDQNTGNVSLKFNPMTVEEDFVIPLRNGSTLSKIETLPGSTTTNDIMDINYMQNKLFAALKVPKPYLNYAEAMPGGSTLAQTDLRFSRTINRFQEVVVMELKRIANIHLHFAGFEDDLDNFNISLSNPSTQQELLKLEVLKARSEVFKDMFSLETFSPASYSWAMQNIYKFSQTEVKEMLRQKKIEKKIFAEIEGAAGEYKETGLFYNLDKKFRRPDYVPGGGVLPDNNGGAGGDFSGGGGGGESSFDSGSSLDTGDMNIGIPGEENAGGETTPGGEQTFADGGESQDLNNIGGDNEEPEKLSENSLLKESDKLNSATRNLIRSIERTIENGSKKLNDKNNNKKLL